MDTSEAELDLLALDVPDGQNHVLPDPKAFSQLQVKKHGSLLLEGKSEMRLAESKLDT